MLVAMVLAAASPSGPIVTINESGSDAACGAQIAIRDSVSGRDCVLTREIVEGRFVSWTWIVSGVPRSDGVAVSAADVKAALQQATKAWRRCGAMAMDDAVEFGSRPELGERRYGYIDWQFLERIRNSSYTLKMTKAIAAFTPTLCDTSALLGCVVTISKDPEVPYGTETFHPVRPARWIVEHQRGQESPPVLPLDAMLMHEYGHSLGLSDIDRSGAIMDSTLTDPQRPARPVDCECAYLRGRLVK